MIINSPFEPAWWLTNQHAQTIYPVVSRRIPTPVDRHECIELPDGDFIELAWAVNGLSDRSPLVILLHGLGGSEHSVYVARLLRAFNRMGFRGVLMHFRGSGASPNRLPRAYHSGDTSDLSYLLDMLVEREPTTIKALVGVSLGGNVLLKWLGEVREQPWISAAVAVSVPFQLTVVADRMNHGFSRVYQAYLLRRLRQLFVRKIKAHGEQLPYSEQELTALTCFWTFDDQITAPLHGFPHVHAYYRQASSRQYLIGIKTPTLIIQALDDPFMTPNALPSEEELSPSVTLELSAHGGHVGFIAGKLPGRAIHWLEHRIPEYLSRVLQHGVPNT